MFMDQNGGKTFKQKETEETKIDLRIHFFVSFVSFC